MARRPSIVAPQLEPYTCCHRRVVGRPEAAARRAETICRDLAACGGQVVIHYNTSGESARRLAEELSLEHATKGGKAWAIAADLGNPREAEALIGRATDLAGRGAAAPGPLPSSPDAPGTR